MVKTYCVQSRWFNVNCSRYPDETRSVAELYSKGSYVQQAVEAERKEFMVVNVGKSHEI
jgi:hypothetical protein